MNINELLELFEGYRLKWLELLDKIDVPTSCRDPLSEVGEYLVHACMPMGNRQMLVTRYRLYPTTPLY